MKGIYRYKTLRLLIFTTLLTFINGCQIEGVTNWLIPVSTNVLDTHRGNVLDRTTSNIEAINTVSYAEGLNSGPYLDISYADSRFVISTNAAYENYEENETSQSMAVTVNFRCTGGSFSTLVFLINVIDTNNNAPRFIPSDQFVFTVAPPLPPGFMVTGCLNDIIVRDIDLTTQRIEFGIEDNPFFEIAYDAASSTVDKEFTAILRTTTFIRNIPDALTFSITATDVDLTGDPPLTTTATVTINGDTEFQFPEEPVFTQAFYLANYTEEHQLILAESISLEQGYHEDVIFTLQGEHSSNFELTRVGNDVSLRVLTPLSTDIFTENKNIFLVVRADREYASGQSATVIVQLPEGVSLEFERVHYEGRIEENSIEVPQMILVQGSADGTISIVVLGEYSSYFTAVIQGNIITLSMTPLSEAAINENNFIYLEIVASTNYSSTSAVVTLEIIKDDNVTPVFNQPIYTGAYNSENGLSLEQIVLVQGYDNTVSLYVEGEHSSFFQVIQNGSSIYLTTSTIPPEMFDQRQIVLSLEAIKPRTVGANAAVIISLPTARVLDFEQSAYKGTLQDDVLTLEPITLTVGYDENVNFVLTGDHATYFSTFPVQNQVYINLTASIPDAIISENNIIILTLSASGLNAVTTSTSVLLDVIKDDITTPVFARNIYVGTYEGSDVVIEDINLIQGFDDSVTFRLYGDHAQYFQISTIENNVALSLQSTIPESVIFDEKVLLFNIYADKPLTVGANAAVLIRFPSDLTDSAVLRFTQNTYTGTMGDNILNTESIILGTGYESGTEFVLTGDYSAFFELINTNNVIIVELTNPLPSDAIENNKFIILEIEARRDRATSAWTSLVIDIVKLDVISLAFTEAFYRGVYFAGTGLQFDDEISLLSGWDETVDFILEGEYATYFTLMQSNNSISLTNTELLPETVIGNNSHLIFTVVANKPNVTTARAAIFIDIEKDIQEVVVLRFEQSSYLGVLQDRELQVPAITLTNSIQDVNLVITGEYASYFSIIRNGTEITLILANDLPSGVIEENTLITLELQASYPNTVTGVTAIIIEIFKDHTATLAFEEAYYIGEYSEENGLLFENTISLVRGFDESVSFTVNGDDAQWFTIVENGQNNLTLSVISTIPSEGRSQLVFSIVANKPGTLPASTAIIVTLTDVIINGALRFSDNYYAGSLEGSNLTLNQMTLEGYIPNVAVSIIGDYANYFQLTNQDGVFTLQLLNELPDEITRNYNILIFTIEAQIQNTRTHATIVIEILRTDDEISISVLEFEEAYYTGHHNSSAGFVFDAAIRLAQGYNDDVIFNLEGEHSQLFSLVQTQNSVTLILTSAIPVAVVANNYNLLFVITAYRQGSNSARATIVISLTDDDHADNTSVIGFDRVTYLGTIQNNTTNLQPITLIEGSSSNITFSLVGELSSYFTVTAQGSSISISLQTSLPEELIPSNRIIILEIQASRPQAVLAYASIVFEVIIEDDLSSSIQLLFEQTYYIGSYHINTSLVFETPISLLQGYDTDVQFILEGEQSQWFILIQDQNSVTLSMSSAIPAGILANNQHLVFVIEAQKPGAVSARATIVISLTEELIDETSILGFDRITYTGTLRTNTIILEPITLVEGYSENVTFSLYGDLSRYFILSSQGPVVTISLEDTIPEQLIPDNRIIVLEIQASAPQVISTHATIVFEVIVEEVSLPIPLVFDQTYYTGSYNTTTGLLFETPMTLVQGYDSYVLFDLEGEHSQWFDLVQTQNSVMLTLLNSIPATVLTDNRKLVFVITAQKESIQARATIIISIAEDSQTEFVALFEKVLYEGIIQLRNVQHEAIRISGYSGTNIEIYGEYSSSFVAYVADGVVSVQPSGSLTLPGDVTSVVLELHAGGARAVLLLNVVESDVPFLPSVAFSSPAYFINVEIAQTGVVGRVDASADNGEAIGYSLLLINAHLLERLSVNNEGEIHLFAPVNSGVYVFQVIATTAITQATANATVHLSVEAITVCGEDEFVVPPLIILDRDEEEPHRNLVVLNNTQYPDCQFTLTNRWPADQTWLYVDETGLHATAIDREDESIAFMALSQVQVELLLSCDSDNLILTKRSQRTDWLGPYDFGTNEWIIADTIPYNSRRSIVNLIVNDINDNAPIFIGKEAEPIAVGYPTSDIEEFVSPRSLAELQATDADIGENAALLYWSSESSLAISPTTGFVHVRSGASLADNHLLTVNATDRNGEGLTGSLQLLVKLLDSNNIAVVTVRDAFLDDETTILSRLRDAVGYDVRTLRSVVISDDINEEPTTRKERDGNIAGASLQLYVYGLINKEPIGVDRLREDISNNAIAIINIISTVSLDDHLEGCEICVIPGRDTGLLIATIVLSVLLFILILLIALWFFLRWRKDKNYDQFSDENSLASRNDTTAQLPKPEDFPKPRLNIQDLKKSERRLQNMLNAPVDETSVKNERRPLDTPKSSTDEIAIEPSTSRKIQEPLESILDLPLPETQGPIVIQSIDKLKDAEDATDDEFGEVNGTRRKSVVTFNENVEKFIHVEDDPDEVESTENPGYEIYKL